MFTAIRRIRTKPKEQLVAVIPELVKLRNGLLELKDVQDPLIRLVHFFQLVSPWDAKPGIYAVIDAYTYVNDVADTSLLFDMRVLQTHFNNTGRDQFGWNRTKTGMNVSTRSVFLGNVHGLFTHPVIHWLEGKDEPRNDFWPNGLINKNPYDLVCVQAEEFMKAHIGPMVEIINRLENAAK